MAAYANYKICSRCHLRCSNPFYGVCNECHASSPSVSRRNPLESIDSNIPSRRPIPSLFQTTTPSQISVSGQNSLEPIDPNIPSRQSIPSRRPVPEIFPPTKRVRLTLRPPKKRVRLFLRPPKESRQGLSFDNARVQEDNARVQEENFLDEESLDIFHMMLLNEAEAGAAEIAQQQVRRLYTFCINLN